jgi:hypothetical protein
LTNIADGAVNDPNQLPKVSNKISNREDTGCYDCIQLNLELAKVSSELSSMREIIKILQEKEHMTQQPQGKSRIADQDLDGKPAMAQVPYAQWTYRTPDRKFTRRNYGHPKQEEFPIHVNRYNALCTLIEPQIVKLPITHKTMMMKINSEKRSKKCSVNCRKCSNKREIIIIGDSHAKGSHKYQTGCRKICSSYRLC